MTEPRIFTEPRPYIALGYLLWDVDTTVVAILT
jgi:hypothetical protein